MSWIRKTHEPTAPRDLPLPVRYLRFCPECNDFKPQETLVEGQDRVLRCETCGSSERFVFSNNVLVPEGTLALIKKMARKRAREEMK